MAKAAHNTYCVKGSSHQSILLTTETYCVKVASYWTELINMILSHYYEMTSKKKTISCTFINLMGNIQEYNVGKI